MKKCFLVISTALFALSLAFVSCSSGGDSNGGSNNNGSQTVSVTGVTLNKTSITLSIGGSETLTATIAPGNATTQQGILRAYNKIQRQYLRSHISRTH